MEGVEIEFDRAWDTVVGQRDAQLQQDHAALDRALQEELDMLLVSVRQSLAEDQPELEKEMEKLAEMARQFREGVALWSRKAESGVHAIEERQRALGLQVQETSIRTAARREDLVRRQKQRAEDVKEKCTRILNETEGTSRA